MPDLGWRPPGGFTLNLAADTDFVQTLRRKDLADWPDGAAIVLLIGAIASWPATITGPAVSWNVDSLVVNAVRAVVVSGQTPIRAEYTDASGLQLTWFTGRVYCA